MFELEVNSSFSSRKVDLLKMLLARNLVDFGDILGNVNLGH